MYKDLKVLEKLSKTLLVVLLVCVASCSGKKKDRSFDSKWNKNNQEQQVKKKPSKKTTTKSVARKSTSSDANKIIAYGKRFMGTPYYYGGTSAKTGFDCSGFVNHAYKGVYGKSPLPRSAGQIVKLGKYVSKSKLQKGDLVFFNTLGRSYSHIGIYVGDGKFLHSSTSKGVTISALSNVYYKPKYETARRVDVNKLK